MRSTNQVQMHEGLATSETHFGRWNPPSCRLFVLVWSHARHPTRAISSWAPLGCVGQCTGTEQLLPGWNSKYVIIIFRSIKQICFRGWRSLQVVRIRIWPHLQDPLHRKDKCSHSMQHSIVFLSLTKLHGDAWSFLCIRCCWSRTSWLLSKIRAT